ncbi:hypothetical protein DL764_010620 [Monosporascus ibericus]|uniref:Carrier domain-containing protein n=1 Tax=Monosporascus ibericus TaxID=155417 RepID=A0A4Q4SSE5_9PEZI|nr:hypothetical protein DL764_010620 [Monosporascus ibericus]
MASQQPEPIAIVGSGCRFPGGVKSPSALWKLLERPRDVAQEIPPDRFDTTGFYHPDGTHHGTTNVRHSYLLEEDVRVFDAAFFNISPNEADSIDPQQRLLLETVYEALEAGGHTLEALRGSDTAVYVGTMGVDYNDTLLRDLNTIPTYFATGTNRAIISNRVSYFYDWHGPSMTIDTACSSSLIAVHQGVQALRTGESRVAVACGTQMILGPEVFVFESKMEMLSPTGRSRMWDADADGYARGEGVAAIVMKRLSDAIADGDHIECLIRGTGANQDGYSNGITVPSSEAQAALIHQTYAKAGLDPKNPRDRPQFFEAHGTGTKAGDPKEAAAIYECFGNNDDDASLYVGSVKTVIGHTEGAAGLAGLLKASGIIQKGFIPPNLLFNRLNSAIEPFYQRLRVPTKLASWPQLPEGVPRRVSVNSFGFGGSNAHAIVEEYRESPVNAIVAPLPSEPETHHAPFTPFIFSAVSEGSLAAQLQAYSDHLETHGDINASDLAWTLQSRRSQLPIKAAFSAETTQGLMSKINDKLAEVKANPGTSIGTRSNPKSAPRVLGVFTGQGAQWAAMGAQLICSSDFVRRRIQDLEESLATLPESDRPQWRLRDEMLAGADTSRIAEAELSQPLCTAIQVVLVDQLRAAGIKFAAVVGHSSGEIGAAYAAGFLSDHDAIRIAYYRGLYARLAGNPSSSQKGAMLAVGTSWEDAQDLVGLRAFRGRLAVAAHNSSASVTLSGDADAVVQAKKVFDEEKKFARLLKVDTAYHSHHMLPCGDPYIRSLRACGIQVNRERSETSCSWFSSVVPSDKGMEPIEELQDTYWKDNMTNAVLFADAVKNAVASDPQISFAIEVGPHPALKGPATQNISDVRSAALPYCGVLSRGKNDVQAFSGALGFAWTHLGAQGVDFESYEKAMAPSSSGNASRRKLVVGLPSYQWNHARTHWHESRRSRKTHSTSRDLRWSNLLKVSEIPWLDGHQLQGQVVFPAAGYVAMALEASRSLAAGRPVEVFELHDLSIPRAITFEEDANSGVETLVTLTGLATTTRLDQLHQSQTTVFTAEFSCYSCTGVGSDQEMELMASGNVKIVFGTPDVAALASTPLEVSNMSPVDTDHFYSSLDKLGYGYSGIFHGMSSLKRRFNQSSVKVATYPYSLEETSVYLVHPTMLDVAFQASMLAYSAPGDERLWSLHVPTSIRSIRVNPEVCASLPISGSRVSVSTMLTESETFCGSIDVFREDGKHAMVQVEDLTIKPFAPATEADDRRLFSHTQYDFAAPNGASIVRNIRPSADEVELAGVCERVSFYYLRKWKSEITDDDWANGQPHHARLRDYMEHTLSTVARGQHPYLQKAWSQDTPQDIKALNNRYNDSVDIKLISAVGENIPAAVRGETIILEHMLPNNMLDDFYKHGLGFARYNSFLAAMMKQVAHRYPQARILEIGAGTGGATKSVLESMGNTVSSYTYTDISVGFFEKAAELFKAYSDKMTFKTLDVEKPPSTQGFESQSYDIVIASNVLHATASLQKTLENTRQLLKPGGYLLLLEITNNGQIRCGNIMCGLPGWWVGANDGRRYAPTITPGEWHTALRKSGFSGIDAITPEVDVLSWPFSIMAAQAVDDRVHFLRRPLSHSSSAASIYIDSLVILGSGSLESARIAEDLVDSLGRFCGQATILNGLPSEAEASALSSMSTFVNLVDLDAPIFKGMTTEKMDGLKRLFQLAKHISWITVGAQVDEPYHMASIAFSRAMSHEAGHVSFNHLDLSDLEHGASKVIAEHLLRQCVLVEWEEPRDRHQRQQQLLWSKEPEVFLDRGQEMIPRLVNNVGQNARLNSSRRRIVTTVPISRSNVSIALSADSLPSLVEEVLPVARKDSKSFIRVESSSLMALRVAVDTFLFLGIGKKSLATDTTVVLSTENSSMTTPVASVKANIDTATQSLSADGLLIAVASELLAASLVDTLSPGSSLLVHCSVKDRLLAAAMSRQATAKAVRVTFSCGVDGTNGDAQDPSWVKLNARAPRHVIQRMLAPAKPTHFLDLTAHSRTHPDPLTLSITQALPLSCKRMDRHVLSQHQSSLPQSWSLDALTDRLTDAVSSARVAATPTSLEKELVIQLGQIHDLSMPKPTTSVVYWPLDGEVEVEVRPLDARHLFSQDNTYILVGLTGQIGQSLCEWMVSNGAGCVCLTSRNPKVDEKWLQSFEGSNAIVKIFAMDVTDINSVEKVVNAIRENYPPIAGVANGAMVLHDALFSGMPSSACVIGNSGQTNYAAANGYLNSFARQRRRRGLAASTFDIGRVAGLGYVETAGQAVMDQLTRFGLMAISESEFRQMFAETILAGYPDPKDKNDIPNAVVTTGIRTIRDDEEIQGPWFDNPRFSHCIIEAKKAESDAGEQNKKTSLPVTGQLARAATKEQALEILQDCFSAKLRVVLQLSEDAIAPDAPLVELGVDSLVVVEVRSWFLKELKVDIPVLKVVGGASVAELCQRALEKLPEELLAGIGEQEPSKPAAALPLPTPEVRVARSSSPSGDSSTSGGSRSPNEVLSSAPLSTPSTQLSSRTASSDNLAEAAKLSITNSSPPAETAAEQPLKIFAKNEQISFGQSRFWFLRLLLEDQTTSNVAFYYHVAGNLRIGDLERAVRIVTTRHEALRTCFIEDDTEADQAYQRVMASSQLRLEHKKIKSVDDVAAEYAKLQSHVFDLASGEMLRLVLLTLSPSSHYLLVNYHHIVMDDVSFQVFLSDLEKAYNGQSLGAPRQFPDFSAAQRRAFEEGEMNDELKYWGGIFPAGEQPPVLPLLPMARTSSRVPMKNFGVHQVGLRLGPELAARIKLVSKAQRSTPFHFYLAAFKAMLFSFTEAQDLTIGIADANRHDSDVLGSIGFFLNLLTLRFRRQPHERFADAITEARNTTYAALSHSRLPFDVLLKELNVARSSSHSPFFQAFFDYRQGAQEKHSWGNTQFEFQEVHPGRTAYDITLDVTDSAKDALVMLRAQKGLYDQTAANLLLETYVHFLDTLSSDTSLPLNATPLFSEKQLTQAIKIGRGPKLISDWPETLPHRIEQVSQNNPDKVALMDGNGSKLTYSDMSSRVEAISEALQNADIGPGSRVLVFQQAAADWVCSMLAIMRIGGIYVPLDLRNPLSRLAAVAEDCKPSAVLADDTTLGDVTQLNISYARIIDVSHAAILYTSGSTGTPKGIMVTHSGLRNEIEGYTKTWKLGAERALQQSAFTFNHSSDQIYTGLVNGEQSITYTKATPSEYSLWMQYGGDSLRQASRWRFAFGGGEPLTSTITQEFSELSLPQLRVFNSYGPTEISISSTKKELDYREIQGDDRIPCGYSLPNYYTYVVDEQLRPLPAGMPGELCIGGAGVSLGYLNNEELTTRHFVPDPFASPEDVANGWTRMYRTGDIGHLQDDGAMVFHNRMAGDTQVKIRGLRIELCNIESNIISASGGVLREAVVTLREGNPEFLVVHVVFAPQHNITDKEAFLDNLLGNLTIPQYMIPVAAIPLDKLPLTNHSKVDRKSIQNMPLPQRARSHAEDGELTETMIQLKRVWEDVLGNKELGFDITPSSSFFQVGGNSLLVIRLQSRIRQGFNVTIPLADLLGANTLGKMAHKIEESSSVGLIDWEKETAPPTIPGFLKDIAEAGVDQQKPTTVLVTGSTGFLGKYILPQLAANPDVGAIHCVAVRDRPSEAGLSRK